MNNKIIFFDIDGTIMSHRNYHISASTKNAIRNAQANGHLAFVNTGRSMAEIEDEIKDVGFDGYICGCGTYITYHDEVLFYHTIASETMRDIMDDLRRFQIESVLEGTTAIYFDDLSTHPKVIEIRDYHVIHNNASVKPWSEADITFDKFCIWPSTEEGFQHFYEKYKDAFDFIDRRKNFYEVIPKGYSKASGIEFLLKHLDIPHENTYALGDSMNDLTMLNFVKHSIAMGNSHEDIRNLVSYVTEDVDQDGVYHALKHYCII